MIKIKFKNTLSLIVWGANNVVFVIISVEFDLFDVNVAEVFEVDEIEVVNCEM